MKIANIFRKNRYKHRRPDCICPVCNEFKFKDEYDICHVCSWENDLSQNEKPDTSGGANNLSLNDYRKWWEALNKIMPDIMTKYNITNSSESHWRYDGLIVPRKHIKEFIDEMTEHNICVRLSFYNICKKYNFDTNTFVAFPFIKSGSLKEHNDESINIVFSKKPLEICEKYNFTQLKEILEKATNKTELWEELTPRICVRPNPVSSQITFK